MENYNVFGKLKPLSPPYTRLAGLQKRTKLNVRHSEMEWEVEVLVLESLCPTYIIDVAAILCWAFRVNVEENCQTEF